MLKPRWIKCLSGADEAESMRRWRHAPRTCAVRVLPAKATEEQWLQARQEGIGASEMASVLGVPSAYRSAYAVWWAKHEGWVEPQSFEMKVGHRLEPVIAGLFADVRPDMLVCRPNGALWRHWQHPWMLATPDFLAVAGDGQRIEPVECKSDEGGYDWGTPGTDEVPEHHRIQLLQQCWVLGATSGHLVRLANKRYTAYRVETPGPDVPAEWVKAARAFQTSLELGIPPDPDGSEATGQALARLFPAIDPPDDEGNDPIAFLDDALLDELALAKVAKDDADTRLATAEHRVREQLGRARYAARRSTALVVASRVMYKRDGYEVAPGMVDQLRVKASAKQWARGSVSDSPQ